MIVLFLSRTNDKSKIIQKDISDKDNKNVQNNFQSTWELIDNGNNRTDINHLNIVN